MYYDKCDKCMQLFRPDHTGHTGRTGRTGRRRDCDKLTHPPKGGFFYSSTKPNEPTPHRCTTREKIKDTIPAFDRCDKGKTLDIHLRRYDDDFSFLVIPVFTGIYCFLYTKYPDGLTMKSPQNNKGRIKKSPFWGFLFYNLLYHCGKC